MKKERKSKTGIIVLLVFLLAGAVACQFIPWRGSLYDYPVPEENLQLEIPVYGGSV